MYCSVGNKLYVKERSGRTLSTEVIRGSSGFREKEIESHISEELETPQPISEKKAYYGVT